MPRRFDVTRAQIGAMLATEGAWVSAFGLTAGIGLGWLISLVLIHVGNRQSFHWSMELHLLWGALVWFALAMLALSTLTGHASGRRSIVIRSRGRFMKALVARNVDAAVKEMERNLIKVHRLYFRLAKAGWVRPRSARNTRRRPGHGSPFRSRRPAFRPGPPNVKMVRPLSSFRVI